MLINKIYDKDIKILPSTKLKIDRSLIGKKFEKDYKIKTSSWKKMIKEMKLYFNSNKKLYENI